MEWIPPFCPNKHCPTQDSDEKLRTKWFSRAGWRTTGAAGRVQKYVCRLCRKGFSSRTFDVDYWTHRHLDYGLVLDLLVGGSGVRQSCRTLGVSWSLLANRHTRLARQALAAHAQAMEVWNVREDLVLDGFESFAWSQYYPNNLHLLATADSQFVVALHAAVLRRKGRMTRQQQKRRTRLEASWRASPSAIYRSCRQLFELGAHRCFASLHLPIVFRTDEKKEYRTAIGSLSPYGSWRSQGLLEHRTISSRAVRNRQNPLFAVNYLDRQLRKDLSEHVRETVRFARRIEFSLERAVLHLMHHNYFKAFRARSSDHELTHAEVSGLNRALVCRLRERMFCRRAFGWRESLEPWAIDIWNRRIGVPIHPATPLARHFLAA